MRRDILCAAVGVVLLGTAGCGGGSSSTASAPPPSAPASTPAASTPSAASSPSAPGTGGDPAAAGGMAGMGGPGGMAGMGGPGGMAGMGGPGGMAGMAGGPGMTGPPPGMSGPGGPMGPMGAGGAGFGPMGPMGVAGAPGAGYGPMGPMGAGVPGVPGVGPMGPMGVGVPGVDGVDPTGPMGVGAGAPGAGPMGPMGVGAAGAPGIPGGPMGPMGPMGAGLAGAPGIPGGPTGFGGFPGGSTPVPEPVTLMDFAKRAFREGNDKDGFDYLCAHYLCNEKEGEELKSKLKWSAGLKRPVLAVRIGVGVYYTFPKDFNGDPQPVGRVKDLPTAGGGGLGAPGGMAGGGGEGRRGRRGAGGPGGGPGMPGMPGMAGGGMPGMGGAGSSAPTDGRGLIDYYTGEFGSKFLESLESRISDGKFGDALKDFESPPSAGAGGGPGMGMAGMGPGGMMPPVGGAGAIGGPMGAPPGAPGGVGGAGSAANSKDPKGIMPGLVILGLGNKATLEQRAKNQNLDLMFVLEVNVKQNLKNDIVNNKTVLKLYDLQKSGEVVFTSATIDAVGVTKSREKPKDKDPVDVEVDRVMNVLDNGIGEPKLPFVVRELPPMKPEHAMTRLARITSSQEAEPLAHMVEIRAFKAMGLITDKQYQDGVKGLIGPEKGEALFKSNKEEDRKAVLATSFLPRKGKR